jgi:hypothetical protein
MNNFFFILFYIINIKTLYSRRIHNTNNNKVLLNDTYNENNSFDYLKQRKLQTANPEDHRYLTFI